MKSFFLSLLVLLIASSCNSNRNETSNDEVMAVKMPPPPPVGSSSDDTDSKDKKEVSEGNASEPEIVKPVAKEKKIIKDGTVSVKTNDIAASKKNIDGLIKKLNGYYEVEDLQNTDQSISYDLKIRVPADNFEKLISSIENGKDELTNKSIQARDVTEEFVDITTRLANKREYLKRYKELLSRASTVKDILAIEENIRVIEEEIESKEGRLKYLNDQVSFSTLNLNLYKEKEYIYKAQEQDKFSERVKNSLSQGWTTIVDFLLWLFSIWPFIILITGVVYIIRKIRKKRKNQVQ